MNEKTYNITLTQVEYDDYLKYLTTAPNIQDVKKPKKAEFGEDNKHPTIKPVKLMEWLIKLTTNENDTVLDIFAGSGTTLQAATNLNRNAVGIELNEEYLDTIKGRAPNATIYHGDCIEVLKGMEPGSVDAIITDPPYAIAMADWDKFQTLDHFGEWCHQWATECYRVLRPGGILVAFNAARTYHYMAYNIDQAGFICRDMVEWVYWSGMPKGKNLKQCHEPIYLGWKSEKNLENFTFNIDACRIPVKEKKNKKTGKLESITINNKTIPVEENEELFE